MATQRVAFVNPNLNGMIANRNVDLGALAMSMMAGIPPTDLPERPKKTNSTGKDVNIRLNSWEIDAFPQNPVYQYDVVVGNGQEKRGTIKAMWESQAVQSHLGKGFIFDGNKIAWGPKKIGESRIDVDLNAEENRGSSDANKKRVTIKFTKVVDFATLRAWLNRTASFDNAVLEAINFLDHLMRETPTRTMINMKRNFFAKGEQRVPLGGGVEAGKGVYASIRPTLNAMKQPSLAVNVDVANTTFWSEATLIQAAGELANTRTPDDLVKALGASGDGQGARLETLKPFRGVNIVTKHLKDERSYKIKGFLKSNARSYTFNLKDQATGTSTKVNLETYFRTTYRINLKYPNLPVVETTKQLKATGGHVVLPMELCHIRKDQRYALKLSDKQTSEMIKFAVTLPDQRWGGIIKGLGHLAWERDQYLSNYGLRINTTATAVKGRLLPAPKVNFGAGKSADPKVSGRWDLRGMKFLEPNPTALTAWGVLCHPGRGGLDKAAGEHFAKSFITAYKGHGGKIANEQPHILVGGQDVAASMEQLYNTVGKAHNIKPQILFIIVPDKNSTTYNRIKMNGECRWGICTQVLQAQKAGQGQAQYCSNVAMKVNAKLGGSTSATTGVKTGKGFPRPTMIIGADVSHGGAGMMTPSIAAMTVSFDRNAIKYVAAVQTNGVRIEMITKDNINQMLGDITVQWKRVVGGGVYLPQHVIYFRDGVSEGQYAQVLAQEVKDMRDVFKKMDPNWAGKFTVVIATKRHHVRFFPTDGASGDRNKNPFPGTLIESGVTHPFEYDFYLCSHSAIKGTARPVHYHVILDEQGMSVEDLQNYIYESSYTYIRSTTPISLPPPVYYAHLASNRGIAHIAKTDTISESGTGNQIAASNVAKLRPMLAPCRGTMWFI